MLRMMEEMKNLREIKEQGRGMKEKLEGLRKDMREIEERWRKEKQEFVTMRH